MAHWGVTLVASVMAKLLRGQSEGRQPLRTAIGAIVRAPLKSIAVFLTAPFLAYRIARFAKNPVRRIIAGVGLVISVVAAWFAGTALGIGVTAMLLMAHVGVLHGIAFWLGAMFSFTFSVAFSLLALNATATLFVGLSSEEVVRHLEELSR